jgi:hypothetical protein
MFDVLPPCAEYTRLHHKKGEVPHLSAACATMLVASNCATRKPTSSSPSPHQAIMVSDKRKAGWRLPPELKQVQIHVQTSKKSQKIIAQ